MAESRIAIALNDEERFPCINDLSFLNQLRQDEYAPKYNFKSGDRLERHHLNMLKEYKQRCKAKELVIENAFPHWVEEYVQDCVSNVPFYKGRANTLGEQSLLLKEYIRKEPWLFVHKNANVDELLVYSTSGTTGPATDINFSPFTQSSWIVQLEEIMNCFDLRLRSKHGDVAIALICNQDETLTYASLSTYLNGAGVLKINLNTKDWNHPADCLSYLEKYNPEILTGDPIAFSALMDLNPELKPKIMVSSAMRLMPEKQKELEDYFRCPVIDLYSMTECRMIAFRQGLRYRTIRPDLYLEVMDPDTGKILPFGSFGELLITGGNNPFLHLIRYRTGDYGKLILEDGIQFIEDFEAREPVVFYDLKNKVINPVDISRAMMKFAMTAYHIHQNKDYSLVVKLTDLKSQIEGTIKEIFGDGINLTFKSFSDDEMKNKRKGTVYSSDIR